MSNLTKFEKMLLDIVWIENWLENFVERPIIVDLEIVDVQRHGHEN